MAFPLFSSPEDIVLCDGGIETTLYYKHGFPMRHQAGFEALFSEKYHAFVEGELLEFVTKAAAAERNITLDTLTYRASRNFYDLCETPAEEREVVCSKSMTMLERVRDTSAKRPASSTKVFMVGCLGSLGDGYSPESCPTPEEAQAYHSEQIASLVRAGTDFISAYTLTSSAEAIGVARACAAAGMPCAISFTLEGNGKLSLGETLGEAIEQVEAALPDGKKVMFFGVNCIYPNAMRAVMDAGRAEGAARVDRIKAFRGNCSKKSHEELENSTELDEGNPAEWARDMESLRRAYPALQLIGGCCGTGLTHHTELLKVLPKNI